MNDGKRRESLEEETGACSPPANRYGMGTTELWLGAAGSGKTGRALAVLQEELRRDWRGVRYLVPTVGISAAWNGCCWSTRRTGLFGDPVNIFFSFAQEVAQRGGVRGSRLSELHKHLLLQRVDPRDAAGLFRARRPFPRLRAGAAGDHRRD